MDRFGMTSSIAFPVIRSYSQLCMWGTLSSWIWWRDFGKGASDSLGCDTRICRIVEGKIRNSMVDNELRMSVEHRFVEQLPIALVSFTRSVIWTIFWGGDRRGRPPLPFRRTGANCSPRISSDLDEDAHNPPKEASATPPSMKTEHVRPLTEDSFRERLQKIRLENDCAGVNIRQFQVFCEQESPNYNYLSPMTGWSLSTRFLWWHICHSCACHTFLLPSGAAQHFRRCSGRVSRSRGLVGVPWWHLRCDPGVLHVCVPCRVARVSPRCC